MNDEKCFAVFAMCIKQKSCETAKNYQLFTGMQVCDIANDERGAIGRGSLGS